MAVKRLPKVAERVVADARASRVKNDYRTYQHYVNRLRFLDLSPKDYEEAVKRIAAAIGV